MGKYASKECSKCHIRRPVNNMEKTTVRKKSGNSGMGFSFNPQRKKSVRLSSGRNYYKNTTVWLCKNSRAHGDPHYYERLVLIEQEKAKDKAVRDVLDQKKKEEQRILNNKLKAEKLEKEKEASRVRKILKEKEREEQRVRKEKYEQEEKERNRLMTCATKILLIYKDKTSRSVVDLVIESKPMIELKNSLVGTEIENKKSNNLISEKIIALSNSIEILDGKGFFIIWKNKYFYKLCNIHYPDGQTFLSSLAGSLSGFLILIFAMWIILYKNMEFVFSSDVVYLTGVVVGLIGIMVFHKRGNRKNDLSRKKLIDPLLSEIRGILISKHKDGYLGDLDKLDEVSAADKAAIKALFLGQKTPLSVGLKSVEVVAVSPQNAVAPLSESTASMPDECDNDKEITKLDIKELARYMYEHDSFFDFACVKLAKGLAAIDNNVTAEEEAAFLSFISLDSLDSEEKEAVDKVMEINIPQSVLIKLILKKSANDKDIIYDIINNLFYVAESDGEISPDEIDYIKSISAKLEVSTRRFNIIKKEKLSDYKENTKGVFVPFDSYDYIDDIFDDEIFDD